MSGAPSSPLASLVARADAGDAPARDALFAALYAELHRLAESHLRQNGGDLTLGATTLLHEAYVDIAGREALAFPDRNRFFGYASRAMRSIVIDYVRQRRAQKRGGDLTFTTLNEERDGGPVEAQTSRGGRDSAGPAGGPRAGSCPTRGPEVLLRLHLRRDRRRARRHRAHGAARLGQGPGAAPQPPRRCGRDAGALTDRVFVADCALHSGAVPRCGCGPRGDRDDATTSCGLRQPAGGCRDSRSFGTASWNVPLAIAAVLQRRDGGDHAERGDLPARGHRRSVR